MTAKNYLVPVDFSKSSTVALGHAAQLAKQSRGILLVLLHVITDAAARVPFDMRDRYYGELKSEAKEKIQTLLKQKKFKALKSRVVVITSSDAARAIAGQAKKSKVSMIVMGTQGRTGLTRLVLGSVAERTLRYAPCPVLIVKA